MTTRQTCQDGSPDRRGFHLGRFLRNAALISLACFLVGWGYKEQVHPHIFPKNFGPVVEGQIYRSGELTPATTEKVVRRHGIRLIVDLGAHELGTSEELLAQRTAADLGVERVRLPLFGDAQGDPNQYVRALRLATDPANQPVLIHCAAGSERTGCAVAMYRNIYEGVPLEQGLAEATTYKHDPSDNPHVMRMLREWTDDVRRALETGEAISYDGASKE